MIENKIQIGTSKSTFKKTESIKGTLAIGTCAYLKNDNTISNAKADGAFLGVVIGSKNGYNDIVRIGSKIPVKLTAAFEPAIGGQVAISDTTGIAIAYTGSGNSYINALYRTEEMDALNEDGTASDNKFAYIDLDGGQVNIVEVEGV